MASGATMIHQATETPPGQGDGNLLVVNRLKKHFPITKGLLGRVIGYTKAVDDISFTIRQGETLGLVGESGCGKTTAGRCILRAYRPTDGEILYRHADGRVVDLATLEHDELRPYRRDMRVIFQDPYSSLNPRLTVFNIVSEVLKVNKICPPSELQDKVEHLLTRVGLRPEYMQRYPHAFSGGERQRIVIARALITEPRLVVCDEAVSALDVSIRAQILNLLEELQRDFDLTYLFIAHDLSVVHHVSDRVAIMYLGKLVEEGPTDEVFVQPAHPYTQALMAAVPVVDRDARRERIILEGTVPSPIDPPSGCRFHTRCFAKIGAICEEQEPIFTPVGTGHAAACHLC
jgi:peptide/nickel transport system ATP-binding protein